MITAQSLVTTTIMTCSRSLELLNKLEAKLYFMDEPRYPLDDEDPRLMWRMDFERDEADKLNYLPQNEQSRL